VLVFLGPPGAGKGTQAQVMGQKLGLLHLSTGELLRKEVAQGSALGREAKAFMDRGELVPDDVVIRMVESRVSKPDSQSGFILDGFPRTRAQAEALASRTPVDRVFLFEVADEDLVRRLSGRRSCPSCGATYHVDFVPPRNRDQCDACGGTLVQRDDDKPETVRARLSEYRKKTEALVGYYRDRALLEAVDASRGRETVEAALLGSIRALRETVG
jgi:adenylate kinase